MKPKELPIPPAVRSDPKAKELIRLWAAHEKEHVTIAAHLWEDPATWGIALVDLAKHLALAYSLRTGMAFSDVLARIRQGFDVEWNHPTDEPQGGMLDE